MRTEYMFTVKFVGDYFALTTNIYAETHAQAIENAAANIENHHGFNIRAEANEATAECDELPDDDEVDL